MAFLDLEEGIAEIFGESTEHAITLADVAPGEHATTALRTFNLLGGSEEYRAWSNRFDNDQRAHNRRFKQDPRKLAEREEKKQRTKLAHDARKNMRRRAIRKEAAERRKSMGLPAKKLPDRGVKYTYQGETLNLAGWARKTGILLKTLCTRIARGWTIDRAIATVVRKLEKRSKNG